MKRPDHLSYSQIAMWQRCPLSYRLRYLDGLDGEPVGPPARIGSHVHRALEHAARSVTSGTLPADIDALFVVESSDHGDLDVASHQDVVTLVSGFLSGAPWYHRILAAEHRFEVEIDGVHPPILGYIDRIDQYSTRSHAVVDYKTGRRVLSYSEAESDLQLAIYALAVLWEYPDIDRVHCELHYVRSQDIVRVTYERERIDELESYVRGVCRALLADDDHEARPGSHCSWCSMARHCTAEAPMRGVSIEEIIHEREAIAGSIARLKRRKEEIDSILRHELDSVSELSTDTGTYRLARVRRRKYPPRETIQALVDGGVDRDEIDSALTVRAPAAERLSRRHGVELPEPEISISNRIMKTKAPK